MHERDPLVATDVYETVTRAELCKARAATVGWAEAVRLVYGSDGFESAREYAVFLRSHGMTVRDIVTLCKFKFGIGSNQSILDWTDPQQYRKHLARNKQYNRES